MPGYIRRRTTCSVPEHGTRCEVSQEKADRYPRCLEERLALEYERVAEGDAVKYPSR